MSVEAHLTEDIQPAAIAWNDIPQSVFDVVRDKLWVYTATVFTGDGSRAAYVGTATFVSAAGVPSILTAAHVWNALPGRHFSLSLEPERELLIIDKNIVRPTIIESGSEDWGPDIALIGIPDPLVSSRIRVHKAFYDLDRRRAAALAQGPRYDEGIWCVLGAPAEQAVFCSDDVTLQMGLFACGATQPAERNGFDYADLQIDRVKHPHLPESYGGVSGAGLWQVNLLPDVADPRASIVDVALQGVAFYEEFTTRDRLDGRIRCHGRKSIYTVIDRAVEQEHVQSVKDVNV